MIFSKSLYLCWKKNTYWTTVPFNHTAYLCWGTAFPTIKVKKKTIGLSIEHHVLSINWWSTKQNRAWIVESLTIQCGLAGVLKWKDVGSFQRYGGRTFRREREQDHRILWKQEISGGFRDTLYAPWSSEPFVGLRLYALTTNWQKCASKFTFLLSEEEFHTIHIPP